MSDRARPEGAIRTQRNYKKGTTGTSRKPSPRGDASTSGAPTAPGAHNTGAAKEPGAVQKGVNKQ